jgi:FkbM family methyltransferase
MADTIATLTDSLSVLFDKGVRYTTVIDCGCADGHFFVQHYAMGYFAGAVPMHVDASLIYESSLKAIAETVGGHYAITAVADRVGDMEMTLGVHPYWSSLRAEGDPYWQTVNALHRGKVSVPATTIDALVRQFNLNGPFLLKLDLQGAEATAFRGAAETLKRTSVVICEADLSDFRELDRIMESAGFNMFDIAEERRIADRSLGWFYPIYLHRRLDSIKRRSFWDAAANDAVIDAQIKRRASILAYNADVLRKLKASRGQ